MQSSGLSQKFIKEFFDWPYRHARKSGHPEVFEILDSGSRQRSLRVLLSSLLADKLPNRFMRNSRICREIMVSLAR